MASIFDIKPNVVTRDLSGKSFLFYGEKKSGKTTNACKFPDAILLAFEKGFSQIPGVIAQKIFSWRDALNAKKELINDAKAVEEGKAERTHFKTVIIDTGDIAYDYCEKFILMKENVEYLDETESKRGYRAVSLEFDSFLQDIVKWGYTLIVISHSTSKQVKEAGEKYDRTIPTMQNRGLLVVSRMVDIIGYSCFETDDEGNTQTMLIMRGNKFLEAGSRNKYTSDKIPFTYEALRDDMARAVDMLEKETGIKASTKASNAFIEDKDEYSELTFKQVQDKLKEYAIALHHAGKSDVYQSTVNGVLGKNATVKDADPSQFDLLLLILQELEDMDIEGVEKLVSSKKSKKSVSKKPSAKDEDESENEDEDEAPAPSKKKVGRPKKETPPVDEDDEDEENDEDDGSGRATSDDEDWPDEND